MNYRNNTFPYKIIRVNFNWLLMFYALYYFFIKILILWKYTVSVLDYSGFGIISIAAVNEQQNQIEE